jgi:hypothetical protein
MAGVQRAERALQEIINDFKFGRTAKLTVSTERGILSVNLEENFDRRREVPATSRGLDSRRASPSWQRRREQRAADPAVRQRAAAHAEKVTAAKAAAEKAAAEKAAAEKAAAEKAATSAEKAEVRGEGESSAGAKMTGVARQGTEAAAADTATATADKMAAAAPYDEAAPALEERQHRALRRRDQLPAIDRLRDGAGEEERHLSPVKEDSRLMCWNCEAPMSPQHQCSDLLRPEDVISLDEKVEGVMKCPDGHDICHLTAVWDDWECDLCFKEVPTEDTDDRFIFWGCKEHNKCKYYV